MIELRLALHQAQEWRAKETVAAIRRQKGSCDSVWLTMMGFYPPLWKHEEYADAWLRSAEIFREAGIGVSLQVANTVGHGDSPTLDPVRDHLYSRGLRATTDEDPYLVGPDGRKNIGCFCWRSNLLREYLCAAVKIYVERLHPDYLWIDDDLRAHNHAPNLFGCFCDRCISAFNREHDASFTREELVWEINYGDTAWRERYMNFCSQGIYELTHAIASACHESSPSTCFGSEYAHTRHYLGRNDDFILGALHDVSGNNVKTRPGSSHYNDKSPFGQIDKAFALSAANEVAPPFVREKLAEIEDLPGVAFGKSIGGIINEGTLDLAFGCTGLTFTDLQSCHEPIEYYEKILAAISKARPYWERLSRLSETAHHGGVCVFMGEKPNLRPLAKDEAPFSWVKFLRDQNLQLLKLGVPISYNAGHPAAYLINHETVDALTDRDIEFLLTQPVIADGACVAKLCQRGYASRFPLTPVAENGDVEEHFPPAEFTNGRSGMFYQENSYAATPMQRYIFRDLDDRTTVLGDAYRSPILEDGAYVGACTVITEIAQDAPAKPAVKWAIFGYCIWNDLTSAAKRNQILYALDEIATMPAKILSEEQAVLIPSVNDSGKTLAVTVASASQSGTDRIKLLIRHPAAGKRVTLQNANGRAIGFEITECNKQEMKVLLDPLIPYEVVTLFFDQI